MDTTAPSITCPANTTVECDADSSSTATSNATATDNCDPAPVIIQSDSVADGTCPQASVITRTWTATDDCGNTSSCDQTITVTDTTVPVITCPADTTVNCNPAPGNADCLGAIVGIVGSTDVSATGSATATDTCDPNPAVSSSSSVAAGSCLQEKVITRTWTATDNCGNVSSCAQVITVVDDTAPVMTCPDDLTVNCEDDLTVPAGSATDNCDLAPDILHPARVAAGSCPQDTVITRTWTTADDCGNASSCVQIVTVVDNEAPVITCPDDTTVECLSAGSGANCIADLFTVIVSTDPSNTGSATATDNCDSPSVSYSDTLTAGTCPQENVITRSWTAADACGNSSSSCDQVITVVDNTAPTITCPADVTVDCEDDSSSAGTGSASATDNCDSDVTVTESDSVAGGTCAQESVITRTWTATDDCGNASSCNQTVTVVDNEAPVITCPADVTVACMAPAGGANCLADLEGIAASTDSSVTGSATASDNCGTPSIVFSDSVATGSCPQEDEITRTWTATDECGNVSNCDQIINVVDNSAPIITCPVNSTVNCEDDSSSANTGVATATDNCDNDVTISESDSAASGSCPQENVITRTWSAEEACGNSSRCDQKERMSDV